MSDQLQLTTAGLFLVQLTFDAFFESNFIVRLY